MRGYKLHIYHDAARVLAGRPIRAYGARLLVSPESGKEGERALHTLN